MEAAAPFSAARHIQRLGASFAQACEAAAIAVDDYVIGGLPITLQCATPELRARLTPAFAHLPASAGNTPTGRGLTVHPLDSAATGAAPPPLPAAPPARAPRPPHRFPAPPPPRAYH